MKRFLALFAAFLSLGPFCLKQTDGFAVNKLSKTLLNGEGPTLNEDLLDKTYLYAGKGGQCYVFFSHDGDHVLKLLRSSKLQTQRFFHFFFPANYLKEKIGHLEELEKKSLRSYRLAASRLKRGSALDTVHLTHADALNKSITIVDKLGISHTLDPNVHPFVIQKRCQHVKEAIANLMSEGEIGAAMEALSSLRRLIRERKRLEIVDPDAHLVRNFGFIGQRAVQFDPGRYEMGEGITEVKLQTSARELKHWLELEHPELVQHYNEIYGDFLQ